MVASLSNFFFSFSCFLFQILDIPDNEFANSSNQMTVFFKECNIGLKLCVAGGKKSQFFEKFCLRSKWMTLLDKAHLLFFCVANVPFLYPLKTSEDLLGIRNFRKFCTGQCQFKIQKAFNWKTIQLNGEKGLDQFKIKFHTISQFSYFGADGSW